MGTYPELKAVAPNDVILCLRRSWDNMDDAMTRFPRYWPFVGFEWPVTDLRHDDAHLTSLQWDDGLITETVPIQQKINID